MNKLMMLTFACILPLISSDGQDKEKTKDTKQRILLLSDHSSSAHFVALFEKIAKSRNSELSTVWTAADFSKQLDERVWDTVVVVSGPNLDRAPFLPDVRGQAKKGAQILLFVLQEDGPCPKEAMAVVYPVAIACWYEGATVISYGGAPGTKSKISKSHDGYQLPDTWGDDNELVCTIPIIKGQGIREETRDIDNKVRLKLILESPFLSNCLSKWSESCAKAMQSWDARLLHLATLGKKEHPRETRRVGEFLINDFVAAYFDFSTCAIESVATLDRSDENPKDVSDVTSKPSQVSK